MIGENSELYKPLQHTDGSSTSERTRTRVFFGQESGTQKFPSLLHSGIRTILGCDRFNLIGALGSEDYSVL